MPTQRLRYDLGGLNPGYQGVEFDTVCAVNRVFARISGKLKCYLHLMWTSGASI